MAQQEPKFINYGRKDLPTKPVFVKPDQLTTDLYTSGGQYMLLRIANIDVVSPFDVRSLEAVSYVGYYHRYMNGAVYTGRRPSQISEKLDIYQNTLLPAIRLDEPTVMDSINNFYYRRLGGRGFHNHITPDLYIPDPSPQAYRQGQFVRYFAKRRNTDEIIEINEALFNSYNSSNVAGLDQFTYIRRSLNWSIVGTAKQCSDANQRVLAKVETDIPGITNYLSDLLEFWRGDDIIDDEYQYTTGNKLRYADGRDYIGFYHILTDGTLKEGIRASSTERATLFRV